MLTGRRGGAWAGLTTRKRPSHNPIAANKMKEGVFMKLTDSIKLAVKGYKPADIKRLDESGLDTDTILALSGAGYSVNDVDELINIASKGPDQQEPPNEPEGKLPDNPDGQSGAEDPDNVDYKQKLADTMKLLEESQQTIKKLQEQNASKSLTNPEQKSPKEIVDDALRNLY